MSKKVYIAARYSRNAEMRGYRDLLHRCGYEVTSRWIDQHGGQVLESIVAGQLNADPEACAKYAQIDLADIQAADIVISFTSAGGGGKGGRHIEFGYALALGKKVVVVGPRENVFHTLPAIEHYPDWPSLVDAWFPGIGMVQRGREALERAELDRTIEALRRNLAGADGDG